MNAVGFDNDLGVVSACHCGRDLTYCRDDGSLTEDRSHFFQQVGWLIIVCDAVADRNFGVSPTSPIEKPA